MKKILVLCLVAVMSLGLLTACGGNDTKVDPEFNTPTELLKAVWNEYGENEVFEAGYMNEAGEITEGPADFGHPESSEALLAIPSDVMTRFKTSAILMHLMNGNTFTAGAFEVDQNADFDETAKSVNDGIMSNRWMCGSPEKMIVAKVGDNYLVSAFGTEDNINVFKDKLTSVFSSTQILFEEVITG